MKSNVIILIVATILVGLGIYWYMATSTGNQSPVTTVPASDNAAQVQFDSLNGLLQPITFNQDIFDSPNFTSLVDIGIKTTYEAPGRTDPFAIIPGVSGNK